MMCADMFRKTEEKKKKKKKKKRKKKSVAHSQFYWRTVQRTRLTQKSGRLSPTLMEMLLY